MARARVDVNVTRQEQQEQAQVFSSRLLKTHNYKDLLDSARRVVEDMEQAQRHISMKVQTSCTESHTRPVSFIETGVSETTLKVADSGKVEE